MTGSTKHISMLSALRSVPINYSYDAKVLIHIDIISNRLTNLNILIGPQSLPRWFIARKKKRQDEEKIGEKASQVLLNWEHDSISADLSLDEDFGKYKIPNLYALPRRYVPRFLFRKVHS